MIEILQGDILSATYRGYDLLVNPANNHLAHGGGLARVIQNAAEGHPQTGRWIQEQQLAPLVPTGGAIATSAGVLPYLAIIHAVGPVWGGGEFAETKLLVSAHQEALKVAMLFGQAFNRPMSIAFPAISCGIFGFPVDRASHVAVQVAKDYIEQKYIDKIGFYLYGDTEYEAYTAVADDILDASHGWGHDDLVHQVEKGEFE